MAHCQADIIFHPWTVSLTAKTAMRRPYSSATLAILVSTYAVSTLSIPLPDPVYVGQEQDPHTLVPPSHRHEPPVESRVNPYHSIADKYVELLVSLDGHADRLVRLPRAPSALHPVQIDAREMEAASRRSSTVPNSNVPFVPPRILARNSAYGELGPFRYALS